MAFGGTYGHINVAFGVKKVRIETANLQIKPRNMTRLRAGLRRVHAGSSRGNWRSKGEVYSSSGRPDTTTDIIIIRMMMTYKPRLALLL